jgi:ribokinase
VFGQIARDLVLVVDAVPTASRSADVYQRRELLGGKGANQAVGLAQLGMRPALAGLVGEDQVGQRLLTQAAQDRVDVSAVAHANRAHARAHREYRRRHRPVALPRGHTGRDAAHRGRRHRRQALFLPGRWVSVLQLQQPPAAASPPRPWRTEWRQGALLDGARTDCRDALLDVADVVVPMPGRPDRCASPVTTAAEAEKAAADLLRQGPSLVALAVEDAGNLVAWPDGCVFLPLPDIPVVDTTGAGDAFVAGLITALAQNGDPQRAARLAAAAAGATVGHPGGRPTLTPKAVQDQLTMLAKSTGVAAPKAGGGVFSRFALNPPTPG